MSYTNEQIIEILKRPRVEGEKSLALHSQRHHQLHVTGKGYLEWWLGDEAKGFESKETHRKKKHICKPTTPRIFEGIQKQYSKIFRAKGDVFEYHFKDNSKETEKAFKQILKNVSHGLSIDDIMQIIWNKAMFEEFNGFFGVELEKEENLKDPKEPKAEICFYPLKDIFDVHIEGNEIEYIILCTSIHKMGKDFEAYRFIDKDRDVLFIKEDGVYSVNKIISKSGIEIDDEIPNAFGEVPFVQVSNYRANVHSNFLKNSPVSKVIPNADTYLSISDDHQVSVKRYQHPIFYSYPVTCPTCNGSKVMRVPDPENNGMWMNGEKECGGCYGSGSVSYLKGDILQGISLPVVDKYEEDGFPAAQAPAGYVENDHESIREQRVELEDQERFIEKGALGVEGVLNRVSVGGSSKDKTATQVESDLQPLHDTLNAYSSNAESVRKKLTDLLGKIYFQDSYEGSYIHYGRKYFLKSEERVVEEFQKAKDGGMNDAFLKELLEETYYVRFENNPMALQRSLMLLDIEPIPTRNKIEEIVQIAPFTSPETLLIKVNFNDLIERFERENMPVTMFKIEQDYPKRIGEIQTIISEYAKEIKPPKPEPIGANSPSSGD